MNDMIFNNAIIPRKETTVLNMIKTGVAIWIKARFSIQKYSVDDFKVNMEAMRIIQI